MVQTLKKEVKITIDNAALHCFAENGYMKTTMKMVADRAKYSVGNLYKYYRNKEDLFYSLVTADFSNEFKVRIQSGIKYSVGKNTECLLKDEGFLKVRNKMIDYVFENRLKAIILLSDCEGTIFSKFSYDLAGEFVTGMNIIVDSIIERYQLTINKSLRHIFPQLTHNVLILIKQGLLLCDNKNDFADIYMRILAYHISGLQGMFT